MKKHLWIFLFAAPFLASLLVLVKVYYGISIWQYSGPDAPFKVKSGEGFSSINGRLYRKKLIYSSKLFYRWSQTRDLMRNFKAGSYIIKKNSTMLDIIDVLTLGKALTITVTIPEGKNLFEIAKLFDDKGVTDAKEFINLATNPKFTHELKIPAERVEGYLYPDTYNFTPHSPPKDIIKKMVRVLRKKIKSLNLTKTLQEIHPIIILASIVEKETGAKKERPRIAGVFHNRLKKRMRLQSDPTTIYGIYEHFNGNLTKRHLLERTPYNTYKINGLPKGPISNPGLESIKAALDPESHKYLYFVSQNDGTHVFSENYKKHLQAVKKFQQTRRNRVGKSWRDLNKNK